MIRPVAGGPPNRSVLGVEREDLSRDPPEGRMHARLTWRRGCRETSARAGPAGFGDRPATRGDTATRDANTAQGNYGETGSSGRSAGASASRATPTRTPLSAAPRSTCFARPSASACRTADRKATAPCPSMQETTTRHRIADRLQQRRRAGRRAAAARSSRGAPVPSASSPCPPPRSSQWSEGDGRRELSRPNEAAIAGCQATDTRADGPS